LIKISAFRRTKKQQQKEDPVQNKENTHYTNIRQKIFAKHNE
jgi:hypothetical protein